MSEQTPNDSPQQGWAPPSPRTHPPQQDSAHPQREGSSAPGSTVPPNGFTPPAPPRSGIRWWVVTLIVVGVLAILGALFGVLLSIVSTFASGLDGAADQELVAGTPSQPVAVQPHDCPEVCFDSSSIGDAVLGDTELNALGITQHDYPWGTYDPTTAGAAYRASAAHWRSGDGSPDTCFFAVTNSPAASVLDDAEADNTDEVQYTGSHADAEIRTTLDQSMRIFSTSNDAETCLAGLYDQIGDCDSITIGTPDDLYTPTITPMPALDLPASVAATGWVRTGDRGARWRAYVADLQHGNLVVRIRRLTDGSNTETEFRTLVEDYAVQLAALPLSGVSEDGGVTPATTP